MAGRMDRSVAAGHGRHQRYRNSVGQEVGRTPSMGAKNTTVRMHRPAKPAAPAVVLYDQYDNVGANSTSSQNFEASFDLYDTCSRTTSSSPRAIPGTSTRSTPRASTTTAPARQRASTSSSTTTQAACRAETSRRGPTRVTDTAGSFVVPIPSPVVLGPGTYWVSVQANMDFSIGGQWGFTTAPSSPARTLPGRTRAAASASARPGGARHGLRHRSGCSGSGLPPERDDRRPTAATTASATTSATSAAHYTISTETGQSIVPGRGHREPL